MSMKAGSLPLQTKVSLTLLIVVAWFAVLSYVILRSVIAPAFSELETEAAAMDLVRAEGAMQTDLENLAAITADWAPWDDIYHYVRGENPGFHKSNLDRPTLENLELDLMVVFALDGTMMWSKVLVGGEEHPVSELNVLNAGNPALDKLSAHESSASRTLGIIQTGLGPAIVSSRPIVRSDNSGPVSGALIMGRFLDVARLTRMRERTGVAVDWIFAGDPDALTEAPDFAVMPIGEASTLVSDRSIASFRMFSDINADPLLLVKTSTPRQISALGTQTVNAGLLFLGIAGILVTVIMWFLLSRVILSPLELLSIHIKRIRESGDLTHRSGLPTHGEIGMLAHQFDNMTAEVHDARQALLDQSFKAGKADTAAEVQHNIRNAMTPMINGLDRLTRAFSVADNLRVDEALDQAGDPDCSPERREKFLQYVSASFSHIKASGIEAADDLNIVVGQARQVENILEDQERFANVGPLTENLTVDEVVTEAAHIIPKGAEPAVRVDLDARLSEFRVRAHKSGLLQVLGNLILNAFESIQRTDRETGKIQLRASDDVLEDKPMIRLTVRDNGRGFNADIAKRIFQRGFTSKKECDTNGLGLHWCANAVAGMGGRIVAESPGEGQGAEFHVLLPTAQGG